MTVVEGITRPYTVSNTMYYCPYYDIITSSVIPCKHSHTPLSTNRKRYHRSSSDEKSIAIGWSEVPAPRVWLGTSRSSSFSVFTFTSDDLMRDKLPTLCLESAFDLWDREVWGGCEGGKGWDGGRNPFPVGCGPCDTWRRVSTWLRFAANCPRYGTELGMKPPYRHRTSPVCTLLVQNITDNIVSRL